MITSRAAAVLAVALCSMAVSLPCAAQSADALGAWDGLMVSPIGAFAPLAADPLDSNRYAVSLRYGRWRYDLDDAVHENFGVTLGWRFAARTQLSATAGTLQLNCGNCSAWLNGGVEVRSSLWQLRDPGSFSEAIGVRASAGAAEYRGPNPSTGTAAEIAVTGDVGHAVLWRSRLSASGSVGLGYGRLVSPDQTAEGPRLLLAGTFGWTFASGVRFEIGEQRILIEGGPVQYGASLSWVGR